MSKEPLEVSTLLGTASIVPPEIFFHIFSFMPPEDLVVFCTVNKLAYAYVEVYLSKDPAIFFDALIHAKNDVIHFLLKEHYPFDAFFSHLQKTHRFPNSRVSAKNIIACHTSVISFFKEKILTEYLYDYLTFFLRAAINSGHRKLFNYFSDTLKKNPDLAKKFIQKDNESIHEIFLHLVHLAKTQKKRTRWLHSLSKFLTLTGTTLSSLKKFVGEWLSPHQEEILQWIHSRDEKKFSLACWDDNANTVKRLLMRGFNANSRIGPTRETALIRAVQQNRLEIVKLLLEQGAKPWLRAIDGVTPLIYAAMIGNREMVHTLLNAHADPNQTDKNGTTPLLLAMERKYIDVITLLIQHGADPYQPDKSGMTPMQKAKDLKREDIILDALKASHQMNGQYKNGGI